MAHLSGGPPSQRALDTYLPEHLKDFNYLHESLCDISTHVKKYYAAMCFGYRLENLQYDSKIMPDVLIEGLVKKILKDSPVMNLPEKIPEGWKQYRAGLSPDLLEIFDSNRILISLPTVG